MSATETSLRERVADLIDRVREALADLSGRPETALEVVPVRVRGNAIAGAYARRRSSTLRQ